MRLVFAEDATIVVLVMIFGASDATEKGWVNFSGEKHREKRSGKVDPKRAPEMRKKGTPESAGWIHAHAGNRRFEDDKHCHAATREKTGESGDFRLVGYDQNDSEQ